MKTRTFQTRQTRRHRAVLLAAAVFSVTLVAALMAFTAQDDANTSELLQDLRESRLEVAVRVALLEQLGTDGLRIEITVRDGEVTLDGRVKQRSSQELAGEVTRSVSGAREVRNRIKVAPDATDGTAPVAAVVARSEQEVADGLLEGRIKLRLLEQLGANAFRLEVEATEGVVSLRGAVPSEDHRRIALEITRSTRGVERVLDLVKVQ